MTDKPERQKLFDDWSETYQQDLGNGNTFPFIGYGDVLDRIIEVAEIDQNHTVLDLGIGTGNLAKRLPLPDSQIWGVDFSRPMLDRARAVLPNAHLIQADLADHDWLVRIQQGFDRILSAYTFHEFPDEVKVALIRNLADRCLHQDGWIIIGDVSFENHAQFGWAYRHFADLWDGDEYYWCAEPLTAALSQAGFLVRYIQVSPCAGVYRIKLL